MRKSNEKTNLAKIRSQKNYTQKFLAEVSKVPYSTIKHCESRHRDINNIAAITVYKLSIALNCDISEILELDKLEQ